MSQKTTVVPFSHLLTITDVFYVDEFKLFTYLKLVLTTDPISGIYQIPI